MIDCEKMSAVEMYNALMKKAYGDNAPKDLYDYPAGSIFSPTNAVNPDYEIDIAEPVGEEVFSDLPWSCCNDRRDNYVKKKTRATFLHTPVLRNMKRLFADGLRNYLELCVIMDHYGKDRLGLHYSFCKSWRLDPKLNFDTLLPTILGSEDVFFATLDKNLSPDNYLFREMSGLIKVQSYGIQRKDLGKHAQVDWVRAQNILQYIGTSLTINQDEVRKYSYNIRPDLIPKRVMDFDWDPSNLSTEFNWQLDEDRMLTIMEILENAQFDYDFRLSGKQVDFMGMKDELVPFVDPLVFAENFDSKLTEIPQDYWDTLDYDELDIVDNVIPEVPIYQHVEAPAHTRADVIRNSVMNLMDYSDLPNVNIHELSEMHEDLEENKAVVMKIVTNVISPHVVRGMLYCNKLMLKNINKEYIRLAEIYYSLNIPKTLWHVGDIEQVLDRAVLLESVQHTALDIYSEVKGHIFRAKALSSTLESNVYRYMRTTRDVFGGINKFVELRKNYWSKTYKLRARIKDYFKEKVQLQIRSKLVKHVKFKMPDQYTFDASAVKNDVMRMMVRYKSKRRKFNDKEEDIEKDVANIVKDLDIENTPVFLKQVDDNMKWNVKIVDVLPLIDKFANEMYQDIIQLLSDLKIRIDVDAPDVPKKDKVVEKPVVVPDKIPVPVPVAAPVPAPSLGMFGGWGDDDEDDDFSVAVKVLPKAVLIDIREIMENHYTPLSHKKFAKLHAEFGDKVNIKDANKVKERIAELTREELLESAVAHSKGEVSKPEGVVEFDII